MKVLLLVHRFPYPPTRGDCLRSWGEVTHLAQRHDVWLACVDRALPQRDHLKAARTVCRDVAVVVRSGPRCLLHGALSLATGGSLTTGYFRDDRLACTLRTWDTTVGFDAVLTFSPAMAPYATLVRARRRVFDMNDVESAKWRSYAQRGNLLLRWLYALEARRLPAIETQAIRDHDITLLVNELERSKLDTPQRERAAVVRTGLDLRHYGRPDTPAWSLPDKPVVGMLGSMSYAPNVRAVNWFGRHVWPRVRAALPGAEWLIVGSRPTRSVRRWQRQPNVTVTGFVDDVRPYLQRMRVFACAPCEQIGVQTKLIEALAASRPTVITPAAAAGIEHADPPPFLVAATADEFAADVLRLLRDDAHARDLAARARALAEEHYDAEEQLACVERWLTADAIPAPDGQTPATISPMNPLELVSSGFGRETSA